MAYMQAHCQRTAWNIDTSIPCRRSHLSISFSCTRWPRHCPKQYPTLIIRRTRTGIQKESPMYLSQSPMKPRSTSHRYLRSSFEGKEPMATPSLPNEACSTTRCWQDTTGHIRNMKTCIALIQMNDGHTARRLLFEGRLTGQSSYGFW